MVENEFSERCYQQQSSVPFLWEEKPGTPKRGWKPETVLLDAFPPPMKLVSSIPFKWEEKPGKPLSCFSGPEMVTDSPLLPLPPAKLIDFPSPSVYAPSSSPSTNHGKLGNMFWRGKNEDNDDDNEDEEEDNDGQEDEMFELDLEAFNFDADESFRSAPSLLANRLISAVAISNAVPVIQPLAKRSSTEAENHGGHETPDSPASETDSNSSSYATGSTSLMGASFLECLFPLFSPDSSFLDKVGCHEKSSSLVLPEPQTEEFGCESNCSLTVRRTPTLGELILMSRRRSYRRDVHTRKHNPSLEFMKKKVFGCCIFGTGGHGIEGLHRRRQLQRLQLL